MYDTNGLEVIAPNACLNLLGSARVGRIAYTDQALPAVQPVTYLLHDGALLIRAGSGSKLGSAIDQSVIAFQVDDLDPDSYTGWAVMVVGQAGVVSDPAELHEFGKLSLRPWFTAGEDQFIRISIDMIDGRRIPTDAPPQDAATLSHDTYSAV